MKIERKSLMQNALGLIGACSMASAGISCAYIVDDHISVLERNDGTFGFKDHKTGKEPSKEIQEKIVKAIKDLK